MTIQRNEPALPAPVQGVDTIDIAKPVEELWPLIADSRQLTQCGPPVVAVDILDHPETAGSRRTVDAIFHGKHGSFTERRIIQDEANNSMAFLIEQDTFGIGKLLDDVGSLMQLQPLSPATTRLTWTFFHQPRGPIGRIMNRLVILRQQRNNRLQALASFKAYAETGTTRPDPANR